MKKLLLAGFWFLWCMVLVGAILELPPAALVIVLAGLIALGRQGGIEKLD